MSRRAISPSPERKAYLFRRNFGSITYVEATRHAPCIFCGERSGTVRTAHLLHSRGAGGDVTTTGPVCFDCDTGWAAGPETWLQRRRMSMDELERRVRAHHQRYQHLYLEPAAAEF